MPVAVVGGGIMISTMFVSWFTVAAVALSVAMSVASYAMTSAKPKMPKYSQTSQGHLINSQLSNDPVRVVYGQCRVGGNRVFVNAAGDDHKYLAIALTWSEGPIEGIATDLSGTRVKFDDKRMQYYDDYKGLDLVQTNNHLGTADQTSDTLLSNGTYGNPRWNDPMKWTAYSSFILSYNEEAWSKMPDITAVIKGRTLYDPRTGTVSWGTGDTPQSQNPALVWLDFMTNDRYGMGISYSLIDLPSVSTVATWCDAQDPWIQFNGGIFDQMPFIEVLQDIMDSFRGYMIWSEGKYYLKNYAADSAVMTLTERDINTLPDRFQISMPGIPETPNQAKVTFYDPDDDYTAKTLTITDSTNLTLDGEPRVMDKVLIGVGSYELAAHIGTYHLKRARYNKTYTLPCSIRTIALDPGDIIQTTHSFPGWTNERMRLVSASVTPDQQLSCTFQEENNSIYDMTGVHVAVHSAYNSTISDPDLKHDTPTGLVATTGMDDTTDQDKLDTYLLFQCDNMEAGLSYEFRYRKKGDSKWFKKVIEDPGAQISEPTFTGTGSLTMGVDGEYTETTNKTYKVEITDSGYPNKFRWSDDGGATWEATDVEVNGDLQILNNGVMVEFASTETVIVGGFTFHTRYSGHIGDYWTFTASPQPSTISVKIGSLPYNTKYYWCVRTAGKDNRKSKWAWPAPTTIVTACPPVPSMSDYTPSIATIKPKKIRIDWSDWPDFGKYFVKKYKIMYKVGAFADISKYTLKDKVDNTRSSYTAVDMSRKVTYDFRIIPVGYTQDGFPSEQYETITEGDKVYASSTMPVITEH